MRPTVISILGICGVWVLYVISLWGMYVFSMPGSEATSLAGFDRYMGSVAAFILCAACALFFRDWEPLRWSGEALALAAFLPLVFFCRSNLPQVIVPPAYHASERCRMEALLTDGGVKVGGKCLIYAGNYYEKFLIQYYAWASADFTENTQADVYARWLPNYDYLVVWKQDAQIQQTLSQLGYGAYISDQSVVIPLGSK